MSVIATALLCLSVIAGDDASAQQTRAATGPVRQTVQNVRPVQRIGSGLLGMLQRNNSIRSRAGLRPHRMNAALNAAAQEQANYMARTGQFSHYVNGTPQSRAYRYGFRGGVRENIAMNGGSTDQAFQQWTASGAHYASIVSGTTDAGFGYAVGRNGMGYFVGMYATPAAGDYAGQTEEQIYAAHQAEREAAQKAALAAQQTQATTEQVAAAGTQQDSNVKPAAASMEVEVKQEAQNQPEAGATTPAAASPTGG